MRNSNLLTVSLALSAAVVAPSLAMGGGVLTWYNDRAAFRADNKNHGKFLKGIEDFEESILEPDRGVPHDDPLDSTTTQFPYPNGILMENIRIQSRKADGTPRGARGLAAVSAPAFGVTSDVVLANQAVDSLDLIFLDELKSGIGFDVLDVFGNQTGVDVSVYDLGDNFLGSMVYPGDAAGSNFAGVWSTRAIGRINLFSTGGGAQGADNVEMWVVPEPTSMIALLGGGLMLLARWRRRKA